MDSVRTLKFAFRFELFPKNIFGISVKAEAEADVDVDVDGDAGAGAGSRKVCPKLVVVAVVGSPILRVCVCVCVSVSLAYSFVNLN